MKDFTNARAWRAMLVTVSVVKQFAKVTVIKMRLVEERILQEILNQIINAFVILDFKVSEE